MLRLLLWCSSLPYGIVVRLRNWGYTHRWFRVQRVPAPVISVGNLTVGGTGKTPAVEWVARFYRRHDLRVAILSRGYGREGGGLNDEARVLYDNLPDVPHLQGLDRVELARTALEELESEILILDDGFQHRRLARDLDLVLIDATLPWGHGYLLPRGLLREPRSGLRRAQVILLTRCDQVDAPRLAHLRQEIARIAPALPVVDTCHEPVDLVDANLRTETLTLPVDQPVAAFCGLGNPQAFQQTLTNLGARVLAFRSFPDHHAYSAQDVTDLEAWVDGLRIDNLIVVTTQKDLVKLRLTKLGTVPLWALRIRLRILQGEDVLDRQLLTIPSHGILENHDETI
jgi:tetraacyldisaccharide 4'-kinase